MLLRQDEPGKTWKIGWENLDFKETEKGCSENRKEDQIPENCFYHGTERWYVTQPFHERNDVLASYHR